VRQPKPGVNIQNAKGKAKPYQVKQVLQANSTAWPAPSWQLSAGSAQQRRLQPVLGIKMVFSPCQLGMKSY
jgi:hypothetical protein